MRFSKIGGGTITAPRFGRMARTAATGLLVLSAALTACGFAMEDLSTVPATADADAGAPGAAVAGDDADPVGVTLPPPGDAGVPLEAGCEIAVFAPAQARSAGSGRPWSSPGNATADDDAKAITSLSTDARDSAMLVVDHLTVVSGGPIPASATIKGVAVDIDRSSGGTCIRGNAITLFTGATARDRTIQGNWNEPATYGGLDDLWMAAPIDPSAFADPATGVGIVLRLDGNGSDCPPRDGRVDVVRVRAQWCP